VQQPKDIETTEEPSEAEIAEETMKVGPGKNNIPKPRTNATLQPKPA
jgi:hypothetical protein